MTRHGAALTFVAFVLAGCSGRRLPPGTAAPEYEPPIVTPWSVAEPDAAPPATSTAPSSSALESSGGASLSLDAGVR